jgi:large subunit ribosomal protein L20
MPRARSGIVRKKRVKKVLEHNKGFWDTRGTLFRVARNAYFRSLVNAFSGRKQKKRDFRGLWIVRINAVCRNSGINYSQFMDGLKKAGIVMNRKTLANLAIQDIQAFNLLIETAKSNLK